MVSRRAPGRMGNNMGPLCYSLFCVSVHLPVSLTCQSQCGAHPLTSQPVQGAQKWQIPRYLGSSVALTHLTLPRENVWFGLSWAEMG